MAAHVAYEVGSDAPLGEAPLSIAPLEAVVVPTADDGLQGQVRQRLQRGEVRTRQRCAGLFVDLNGEIGGYVLRPGRTVVIDDDDVPEHSLNGVTAAHRSGTANKRRVSEQSADSGEVAVVHELGVGCDQALDRAVARFSIGGTHPTRA